MHAFGYLYLSLIRLCTNDNCSQASTVWALCSVAALLFLVPVFLASLWNCCTRPDESINKVRRQDRYHFHHPRIICCTAVEGISYIHDRCISTYVFLLFSSKYLLILFVLLIPHYYCLFTYGDWSLTEFKFSFSDFSCPLSSEQQLATLRLLKWIP